MVLLAWSFWSCRGDIDQLISWMICDYRQRYAVVKECQELREHFTLQGVWEEAGEASLIELRTEGRIAMNKVKDGAQRRCCWEGDHMCTSLCWEEHSSTQEPAKGSAGRSRDPGEDDVDFQRLDQVS